MRERGVLAARQRQERDAERPDKTRGGETARQCERRHAERENQIDRVRRDLKTQQQRLKGQPLADETVERRQRGNRQRTDQKEDRRLGHALDEAAQLFHITRVSRVQNCARAHKQQTLERGVIERVIEPRHERQRCQAGQIETLGTTLPHPDRA